MTRQHTRNRQRTDKQAERRVSEARREERPDRIPRELLSCHRQPWVSQPIPPCVSALLGRLAILREASGVLRTSAPESCIFPRNSTGR